MPRDRHLWPVVRAASEADLQPLVALLDDKSVNWTADEDWSLAELRQQVHDELLLSGGNSLINTFRGCGVAWAELVRNAADKLDVAYRPRDSVAAVERNVALQVLEEAVDRLPPARKTRLVSELRKAGLPRNMPIGKGALTGALIAGRLSGFAIYKCIASTGS